MMEKVAATEPSALELSVSSNHSIEFSVVNSI